MANLSYDDRNLQRLFAAMEPKQRLRTMRGAFRREANRVRRIAINNLRESIRTDKDMERGVRAVVFKNKPGFRVTVGTKTTKRGKSYGFHRNRRGLEKPVLLWAEDGTQPRYTRTRSKVYTRSRKGHYTGRMRSYRFMARTRDEVKDSVTESLHNELRERIIKDAKKYGCN